MTSSQFSWIWDFSATDERKGLGRMGKVWEVLRNEPFQQDGGCVHRAGCPSIHRVRAWALRGTGLWNLRYLRRLLLANRSRWLSLNSDKLHEPWEKGTHTSWVLSYCEGTFHTAPSRPLWVALSIDVNFMTTETAELLSKMWPRSVTEGGWLILQPVFSLLYSTPPWQPVTVWKAVTTPKGPQESHSCSPPTPTQAHGNHTHTRI